MPLDGIHAAMRADEMLERVMWNKLKFHNHNAQVLGPDHGVTKALAKASITMAPADLWRARLEVKTLRKDQREAIAEAGEG